jgi:Zn-dependent alcohol dehydrogenase
MEDTLEQNFRAAVLFEQNSPLKIVTMKKIAPAYGQVAVEMISSSLCGAQWNEITGVKGSDKFLPHMMGHEGLGKVVNVGDGVKKVKPGDFVILHWRKGSGIECFGPKFDSPFGEIGSGSVTTFSEYTIVAENRVTPIRYKQDLKYIYPMVGCALSTSWGLLNKEALVKQDDSLLICGAGGLGMATAFWAKIIGLKNIAIFDKMESKRNYAQNLGWDFYSLEKGGSLDKIQDYFTIVVDTTGNTDNISSCFDRVKSGGKLILVGQPRVGSMLKINNPLKIFDGIKIFSSAGGMFAPDDDISNIIASLEDNIVLSKSLVSHVIKLEEVNAGFELMQSGKAIRVVIDFQGENQ